VNVTEDRGLQLSVVVPTYNEVENIVELIEGVESALRGARFEIIIALWLNYVPLINPTLNTSR